MKYKIPPNLPLPKGGWFDRFTMTFVILSLPKDGKEGKGEIFKLMSIQFRDCYNNVGREKMGKKEIAEKIIKVSGALVRMVIGMGAATLLFLGLRKGRKR